MGSQSARAPVGQQGCGQKLLVAAVGAAAGATSSMDGHGWLGDDDDDRTAAGGGRWARGEGLVGGCARD